MEHLTQFEIAFTIVMGGILFAVIANFIAGFEFDWKEE